MSGGRIERGLGAGWYEEEHRAYGIPFPPLGERFDRLEESLAIITGLWQTPVGQTFTHEGKHFPITDSPALPKPVQSPRPPIVMGGMGKKRTPAMTARYADEFNLPFVSVDDTVAQFGRVREACKAIDRDPDALVYSNALVLCCGRNDEEIARMGWPAPRPNSSTRSAATARPDRSASTCRCSIWPTSTTSNWSRRRSCPRSADPTDEQPTDNFTNRA